jgi:hypothetical protein
MAQQRRTQQLHQTLVLSLVLHKEFVEQAAAPVGRGAQGVDAMA